MSADEIFAVIIAATETVQEHFPNAPVEVKAEIANMLVQSILG